MLPVASAARLSINTIRMFSIHLIVDHSLSAFNTSYTTQTKSSEARLLSKLRKSLVSVFHSEIPVMWGHIYVSGHLGLKCVTFGLLWLREVASVSAPSHTVFTRWLKCHCIGTSAGRHQHCRVKLHSRNLFLSVDDQLASAKLARSICSSSEREKNVTHLLQKCNS